jgi:hypothetical protein
MSIWFCRECKRAFHQDHMLPGWNGLWCPNCVWNEVVPATSPVSVEVSVTGSRGVAPLRPESGSG